MKVITVPIDKIIPYDKNPRKNDDAVEPTAKSIKRFGWQQPIVVDKHNVIVAGHTRYKAAKKLRLKEVPIVYAKHKDGTWLTDEEVNAYRLADNKTGDLAEWDDDLLADDLGDIIDIDMSDFGFDELSDDSDDANVDDLDLSDDITDKYELKVSCDDEKSLEKLFDRLKGEGYKCDIL